MGTRNLTMVIRGGKTKVAQYGQWDGYPSGQGATILKFLKDVDLQAFKNRLKSIRLATKKDSDEREQFLKELGAKNGWVDQEQGAKFDAKYPFDSRDHGGGILELIMKAKEDKIVLNNGSSFAGDSLLCEWAYVVDLDNNVLEVYEGFNKEPLSENERFYKLQAKMKKRDDPYYPVKFIKSFPLNELPSEETFIAECTKEEVEEED